MKNPKTALINLTNALNAAGIDAELDENAQWYCTDNQTHYGMEIYISNYPDEISFCFTPQGKYIISCLDAPILRNPSSH